MAQKINDLFHRIKRLTGKAIGDFNLIEDGDRIAVGVSGGKDSYTLLDILAALRKKAPINIELIAVNIDSGFPDYQSHILEKHLLNNNFRYLMKSTKAYQVIDKNRRPGTSYCAFCARLRRGFLYAVADQLDCNKIALGHHLEDCIETLLLNQFYAGRMASMAPKLLADNGKHTIIRPLVYVQESDIDNYSQLAAHPIIGCSCPVAGTEDQKRQRMKLLVKDLAKEIPEIRNSMISAMGNVQPRHLLDPNLTVPE